MLVAAALGWWLWQASLSRYQTLNHLLVILITVIGLSAWYLACGAASLRMRRRIVGTVCLALLACGVVFQPVYNGAMGVFKWKLRFAREADERLEQIESTGVADNWQTTPRDYPRFLGNGYWAEMHGARLQTDWQTHSPRELWRREIGGGWSSFAIVGNYAVTQEQRGEHELVTCYRLETGQPVWTHSDKARFDPADFQGSLGDIGPRATPTIVGERIFTQGGTGIVNCLDARTGNVIWSRDTAKEFGVPVTTWGKSGSPLVVDDTVIISVGALDGEAAAAAGDDVHSIGRDCSLVAFDVESGDVRWAAGTRPAAYSSPLLADLGGERQIIIVNQSWVTAHRASDGEVLWEHPWSNENDRDASVSQPIPLNGDRLFLSKGYGTGASLLAIRRDVAGRLSPQPVWKPAIRPVMKTKFSNVVMRDGFVYGLDNVMLSCIELETGKLRWKKRRSPEFGYGQIMLIGDAILVLSETGELVLVEASPDAYRELASLQALDAENVTWNNPAFAPPYLVVRNAREAACYELPLR
ncbi:MAG: PQQ-like beta-propeller repeat protein [Planctomycetes bacterium]|nr:PQQ-like beta-propeller repeat protein [Planctomycetota bacterium]